MPQQDESGLTYSGGAARSGSLPELRLIPRSLKWHTGLALGEGNVKYEKLHEIGRQTLLTSNWQRGDLLFFLHAINHLQNHVDTFADSLKELGLFMANPAAQADPGFGEAVDHAIANLLFELGHSGANLAFLIEWLDSGAAKVMMAREVAEVQTLQKMIQEAKDQAAAEQQAASTAVAQPPQDPGDEEDDELTRDEDGRQAAAEVLESITKEQAATVGQPPAFLEWLKKKAAGK